MRRPALDCNGSSLAGVIIMTKKRKNARKRVAPAARRLAEMQILYQNIRDTLTEMTDRLGKPDGATPKDVLSKIDQLNAAHLKLVSAEEAFYAKIGDNPDDDSIDYDAIRADIGCQLDRIRDTLVANGISVGVAGG